MQKRVGFTSFAYIYGWSFSLFAISVSFYFDLPTGYSIVFIGALTTLVGVLVLSKKV